MKDREKQAAYNKIYAAENRAEQAAKRKIYNEENREELANRGRLKKYGVTPDDFKRFLVAQGGVCAICGGLGGKTGLCVDHDHETGKVRGLLCRFCNTGIGNLKDSSDITRRATKYLKQHGK